VQAPGLALQARTGVERRYVVEKTEQHIERRRHTTDRPIAQHGSFVIGPHAIHTMRSFAIDDPVAWVGVCQQVCRLGGMCKNG